MHWNRMTSPFAIFFNMTCFILKISQIFISKLVEIVTSSLDDSVSDKLFPQQFWEVSWNILEFGYSSS